MGFLVRLGLWFDFEMEEVGVVFEDVDVLFGFFFSVERGVSVVFFLGVGYVRSSGYVVGEDFGF